MTRDTFDPLDNAALKRVREVAADRWEVAIIGSLVTLAVALAALLITRAIIRRRRRTFWQRTLDYLQDLGDQGEKVIHRMKDLYDDNVDTDAISKSVGKQVKNVQAELKTLDKTIGSLKERGEKFAKDVRR